MTHDPSNTPISHDSLSKTAGIDRDALQVASEIVQKFGRYLSSQFARDKLKNSLQTEGTEGWREVNALVTRLHEPQALTNQNLPVELRIALGHICGYNPGSTLGYLREALARASTFSGITYKSENA